jgi:hypothetical protein
MTDPNISPRSDDTRTGPGTSRGSELMARAHRAT